jgi:hypothetical protein
MLNRISSYEYNLSTTNQKFRKAGYTVADTLHSRYDIAKMFDPDHRFGRGQAEQHISLGARLCVLTKVIWRIGTVTNDILELPCWTT